MKRCFISNISGVTTQFVKAKNVTGKNPDDICRGLWNKDNIKFGGTNWKVKVNFIHLLWYIKIISWESSSKNIYRFWNNFKVPLPPTNCPIMVVGCSFSHGAADKSSEEPTFVGFVASTKSGKKIYQNLFRIKT